MAELPMFPLGSVLLPHGLLPLHVFEERYRVMTRDVLDGDGEFGVALIERGSEVGGGDVRTTVGTVARVVRAEELPDGRWHLLAVGTPRRLRVVRWLPDTPYPRAEVDELVEHPVDDPVGCRAVVDDVAPRLRRLHAMRAEAGLPSAPVDRALDLDDDPAVASWQIALLAGIGPLDAQGLLEIDDVAARLRRVGDLVDEQLDALAFRLHADGE
jgi:hypothetical protein